jgi:hypothetical protein
VSDYAIGKRLTNLPALRFTDPRTHLAPQLGLAPEHMTSGQIIYGLRRLRAHDLIERIPGTHRVCHYRRQEARFM